jgi:hypothetical protein
MTSDPKPPKRDDDDVPLHPAQIAAYRRMTPEQKLAQASALYWQARALKAAWLRTQHPMWSEAEIEARVREIFLLATT